ncbi:MAG: TnpV protein [Lachnospiraceae bacterium]|nr:TnpV protein [Lachnospiraceae bacterium]
MEIPYKKIGDYLIPDLKYQSTEQLKNIGKYGMMRMNFLKNYRKAKYATLLLQDETGSHIVEIDKTSHEREEVIVKQMAKAQGVDEDLKARDQLAWVGAMNQIYHSAEEIIRNEIIEV